MEEMKSIVELTRQYVKRRLLSELSEESGDYRYTHTLRVAQIGRELARAEGLDEEMLVLACLLHDIGYVACKNDADFEDHGLLSSRIAREFLLNQGYDPEKTESICYGIRVHTQEERDRVRKATVLEESVSDADNIDRFDSYRLYQSLQWDAPDKHSCRETAVLAGKREERIQYLRSLPFATPMAQAMWNEKLDLWAAVYGQLRKQMETTLAWDPEL